MRPRRVILLYAEIEEDLSSMKTVLDVHGYAVIACDQLRDASHLATSLGTSLASVLVIHNHYLDQAKQVVETVGRLVDRPPIVLLNRRDLQRDEASLADVTMLGETPNADVLSRLKVVSCRKRGPKKQNSKMSRAWGVA